MMVRSRPQHAQRFTLVEMLVVVAIIGILAALLMPSLQKSLAVAKTVGCTNQQKQLYAIFCLFADDHDGILPIIIYNESVDNAYKDDLFPPREALTGNLYGFSYILQSRNTLRTYLSGIGSFSCPSDPNTPAYDAETRNWCPKSSYLLPRFRFSYCFENYGYGYYNWAQRLARIPRPSQLVMLMEKDQNSSSSRNYFEKGYPSNFAKFSYLHNMNSGFNAGFSDGHVEFKHLDHEVTYALDYKNNYLYIPGELDKSNWE